MPPDANQWRAEQKGLSVMSSSLHQVAEKSNSLPSPNPPEVETISYVRCCGCFNWTPEYQVNLTSDGLGYALCRLCQLRYQNFRWRREQIDRNIEAYTGGDMGVYA